MYIKMAKLDGEERGSFFIKTAHDLEIRSDYSYTTRKEMGRTEVVIVDDQDRAVVIMSMIEDDVPGDSWIGLVEQIQFVVGIW